MQLNSKLVDNKIGNKGLFDKFGEPKNLWERTDKIVMEELSGNFFPCDSITIRANRFLDVVEIHDVESKSAHLFVGYDVSTPLVGLTVWELSSGNLVHLGVGLKVISLVVFENLRFSHLQVMLSTGIFLMDFY